MNAPISAKILVPPPNNMGVPASAGDALPERIVCLPLIPDRLQFSFDAEVTPWLLAVLIHCERISVDGRSKPVFPVPADAGTTRISDDPPSGRCLPIMDGSCSWQSLADDAQGGYWVVQRGRLTGFTSYDNLVRGIGPWAGVMVLIGKPTGCREDGTTPAARRGVIVSIGSAVCWAKYGQGRSVYATYCEIVAGLTTGGIGAALISAAPQDAQVRPGRLDLCVDHWGYRWTPRDLHCFATRQKKRGEVQCADSAPTEVAVEDVSMWEGRNGITLYVGARGSKARFMRVYDKVAEAQVSGKLPWLDPIWRAYGWEPSITVYRLEVEFGGQWLRSHGAETMDRMRDIEGALWRHFMLSTRHTLAKSQKLRTAPISHIWTALTNITGDMPRGEWAWKPRAVSTAVDVSHLLRQAVGCLRKVEELLLLGPGALRLRQGDAIGPVWDPASVPSRLQARLKLMGFVDTQMNQFQLRQTADAVRLGDAAPTGEEPHTDEFTVLDPADEDFAADDDDYFDF